MLLCICTGIHSCEYLLKKRGEDKTYMFFFTAKMLIWCIMLSLNDSNIINNKSSINQYVCAWNDHNNTAQVIRAHCWLNQEHTMKWGFWMSNFAQSIFCVIYNHPLFIFTRLDPSSTESFPVDSYPTICIVSLCLNPIIRYWIIPKLWGTAPFMTS